MTTILIIAAGTCAFFAITARFVRKNARPVENTAVR
jgi:hypothetical protein